MINSTRPCCKRRFPALPLAHVLRCTIARGSRKNNVFTCGLASLGGRHARFIAAVSAGLLMMGANVALAAEKAQPLDAVDLIKAEYYGHFDKLPPSRKCTPEDARGAWREMAVYESDGIAEVSAQKAKGPRYLAFGEYNTVVWQRALVQYSGMALIGGARNSEMQYISTSAGMLYLYKKSLLQESLLCFIATEATKTYPAGMLLLARPIEKDKSLIITLYAPLGN